MRNADDLKQKETHILGVRFNPEATNIHELVYMGGVLRFFVAFVVALSIPVFVCIVFLNDLISWIAL